MSCLPSYKHFTKKRVWWSAVSLKDGDDFQWMPEEEHEGGLTWSFDSICSMLRDATDSMDEACFSAVTPMSSNAAAIVSSAAARREKNGIVVITGLWLRRTWQSGDNGVDGTPVERT